MTQHVIATKPIGFRARVHNKVEEIKEVYHPNVIVTTIIVAGVLAVSLIAGIIYLEANSKNTSALVASLGAVVGAIVPLLAVKGRRQ